MKYAKQKYILNSIIFFLMSLLSLNFCALAAENSENQHSTPIYRNKAKPAAETENPVQQKEIESPQTIQQQTTQQPPAQPKVETKKAEEPKKIETPVPKPQVQEQTQQTPEEQPETETKSEEDTKKEAEKIKPPVLSPKKQENEEKLNLPNVSSDEIGVLNSPETDLPVAEVNIFESIVKPIMAWFLIISGAILIIVVMFKNKKIPANFQNAAVNSKRKKSKKYNYKGGNF